MKMETKPEIYLAGQPSASQELLNALHEIILDADKSVEASVEPMMGKEMIVYKYKGFMKYALAGLKNYMTLHVLPVYGSSLLSTKYKALLPKASFQKGCINFTAADQMPLEVVRQLMEECSGIDLQKIREDYSKSRKK
jgi:hypothetical protein